MESDPRRLIVQEFCNYLQHHHQFNRNQVGCSSRTVNDYKHTMSNQLDNTENEKLWMRVDENSKYDRAYNAFIRYMEMHHERFVSQIQSQIDRLEKTVKRNHQEIIRQQQEVIQQQRVQTQELAQVGHNVQEVTRQQHTSNQGQGQILALLQRMDSRLDDLSQKVDGLRQRVDCVSQRVDYVSQRVDCVSQRVSVLEH